MSPPYQVLPLIYGQPHCQYSGKLLAFSMQCEKNQIMNTNLAKRVGIIAIGASLIGGLILAPASVAASPTRYMTISADGTIKVIPNGVRINAAVTFVGSTSKQAVSTVATSAADVRTAFLSNGVAYKDIATQSVTVYPEYQYTPDKGSVLIGYRATQVFVVIVRKVGLAGAVVDAIVSAGGDNLQLNGVTPFVLDSTKATVAARTAAVKNAKIKALQCYVKKRKSPL